MTAANALTDPPAPAATPPVQLVLTTPIQTTPIQTTPVQTTPVPVPPASDGAAPHSPEPAVRTRRGPHPADPSQPLPTAAPVQPKPRRHPMGILHEPEEQHFSPALMRSTVVILTCLALLAVLEIWVWLTLSSPFARVSVTGSMIVTAVSFFIAGNTFRLRDIRRRVGNQARAGRIAPIDALSKLPPRETIQRRFLLGAVGAIVGVGTLVLTMVFSGDEQQGARESMVASVLGIVCAMLCFVGGTFARPID
ncbi:conserved membrane hypothetical protein [Frankia canadensis]|uniref:Uncharacterized protein n=2 Tax=Frankia canadensis TaxID=1836972 RepID=A0A2I2KQN7_9ACTN|nr:conserved membrane hypothetical protein [Frankia canadensis]SOU55273.1 conserved membrane hypothetical protein [Frankia canadensis]